MTTSKPLPSFSLPASDGNTYTQDTLSTGAWLLYIYPKDDTPGCTIQAEDFRDFMGDFQALGVQVLGVSKDSLNSHQKFCTKYNLPFPLLTDKNKALIGALDALKEKSMFGKKYMGVDRSTFLIKGGQIVHEWRSVKAKGHAAAVLAHIKKDA